ncbi:MAG: molybdopterin-dependent oxidoreductase, partial [Spirochaetes bacterium]|nr:molybdopterin-dependent oxidoreductase [Spirochaetota bacterium]
MDKILLQKWIHYTWLSDFFADFAKWEKTTHALSPLLGDTWARQARGRAELQQEYDELFKGCHADIYIPLWASACMGRGDILFDETTLDVIKFYYRHGYRPVNMDGNPPDFIGQQLRFLAYLSAASLPQTEEEFAGRFLADTVAEIAKGLRQHAKSSLFADILNILLKITSGDFDTQWDQSQLTFAENFLKMSHDGRVYRDGAAEPIPLGEKTLVKTAGRNNCGGKCPLRAAVQEGCVLYINAGDEKNFPHIRPCLRGRSYRQNYLSGKRLRYPMKRIGERGEGRFKRISWEEAADLAAGEIERIGKTYGAASRYVNYGWGVSAVLRPDAFVMRLLNLDGGFLGHYNTYSFACTFYTTPFIYGDLLSGNGIADVLNTKLLVLWGHNPAETIFGSERNYYLTKAKEKGVRIIVIDPRFSDTAATLADEWIGIRPSTDGALADAMAYVIWSQGLYNKEFMDKYCLGFDEEHLPAEAAPGSSYATYLFGKNDGVAKTPKWAQAITGIPAETIERLACDYATSKPACLLPGYGVQRIGNGEQTVRGIAMLASLTGNIGIPGGGAGGFGGVVERAR